MTIISVGCPNTEAPTRMLSVFPRVVVPHRCTCEFAAPPVTGIIVAARQLSTATLQASEDCTNALTYERLLARSPPRRRPRRMSCRPLFMSKIDTPSSGCAKRSPPLLSGYQPQLR